ncbi:MAG: hypothetical protein AB9869_18775 [Verrucomicrobiia bacterium]
MKNTNNMISAIVITGLALSASLVELRADPLVYATADVGSKLVRIDVGARTVTEIGNTGVPFALAIAISPQGQAFTVTDSYPAFPGTPCLARVDLASGVATLIGPVLGGEEFMGMGFAANGKLYGVNAMSDTPDEGSLYRFNVATGEATKLGVTGGCGFIMDLAWYDGTMYGVDPTSLYRINLTTGEAFKIATITGNANPNAIMGLAIDEDGNFYVSEIVPNSPLYAVNPDTGVATRIWDTGMNFIHGLEIMPAHDARDRRNATVSWTKWVTSRNPSARPDGNLRNARRLFRRRYRRRHGRRGGFQSQDAFARWRCVVRG